MFQQFLFLFKKKIQKSTKLCFNIILKIFITFAWIDKGLKLNWIWIECTKPLHKKKRILGFSFTRNMCAHSFWLKHDAQHTQTLKYMFSLNLKKEKKNAEKSIIVLIFSKIHFFLCIFPLNLENRKLLNFVFFFHSIEKRKLRNWILKAVLSGLGHRKPNSNLFLQEN